MKFIDNATAEKHNHAYKKDIRSCTQKKRTDNTMNEREETKPTNIGPENPTKK